MKTWVVGFALLLLLTFPAAAFGQFSTSSDGKGGLFITGYSGSGGAVVIPGSLGGLPVTGLKQSLFRDWPNLTSVTIPDNVSSIEVGAFANCANLNAVTVSPDNSTYSSSADGVLFNKDQTTLILCPVAKRGSYVIPDSVSVIGLQAFACCTGLTSVTIPNSVTSIGAFGFYKCASLTRITIPNSVTTIGELSFSCSGLTSITIPNNVTRIGNSAFANCYKLTSVTIPDSVTSTGDDTFIGCKSLTSIAIPGSVTSIGGSTFSGCTSLTSVTIPASVTSVGYGAFQGCTSLKNAVFSGDAPTMGKGVFSSTANDFRVLYHPLAAGFASPAWLDSSGDTYPAVNLATLPTPKPVLAPPSPLIGKKISITLKDGTVAAGKIVKVDPDGISIITDDGGGKILYDSMTDADKATYGYHQQANDSSPTEATTPTPTSSVSIGSSPPTEGGWHQVAQFSGSNNKKTEPFTISTERWRIKWTSSLPTALDPKFANMLVCGANCFVDDGSLNNTSVCNQIGPGSDVTESMEPERTTSPFTRHPYGR